MHALPNVPGDLFMFEELSTGEFTGDGQGCHEEAGARYAAAVRGAFQLG